RHGEDPHGGGCILGRRAVRTSIHHRAPASAPPISRRPPAPVRNADLLEPDASAYRLTGCLVPIVPSAAGRYRSTRYSIGWTSTLRMLTRLPGSCCWKAKCPSLKV